MAQSNFRKISLTMINIAGGIKCLLPGSKMNQMYFDVSFRIIRWSVKSHHPLSGNTSAVSRSRLLSAFWFHNLSIIIMFLYRIKSVCVTCFNKCKFLLFSRKHLPWFFLPLRVHLYDMLCLTTRLSRTMCATGLRSTPSWSTVRQMPSSFYILIQRIKPVQQIMSHIRK